MKSMETKNVGIRFLHLLHLKRFLTLTQTLTLTPTLTLEPEPEPEPKVHDSVDIKLNNASSNPDSSAAPGLVASPQGRGWFDNPIVGEAVANTGGWFGQQLEHFRAMVEVQSGNSFLTLTHPISL